MRPSPFLIRLLAVAWPLLGPILGFSAPTIPDIKPRGPVQAAVSALAYHPNGKLLAAGGHKETVLLDVTSGDVVAKLPNPGNKTTALAFSPDGRYLAVAASSAGTNGEVSLYALPASGMPGTQPLHVLAGHTDAILDLSWSPDSKTLASCSYDRLIKLWDAAGGKELRTLKDHSDSVYGVAFSPDGRLLASGAADRAVKVWDVATGVRLYTLGEPTDWVYAVAWSPDGQHLAAAGVDKSIRVWQASATGARVVQSVFAHEGPVIRLAYAADGKTLYSLSEDRTLKSWDTSRMVERKVYPRQPEAVLALALRPDHRQLALGRYDGVLALIDEATGQVQSELLPAKPKPPQVTKVTPASGPRGRTLVVAFGGSHLGQATTATVSYTGATAKLRAADRTLQQVWAEVTFPPTTPAGIYELGLQGPAGQSAKLPFTVDLFPQVQEAEPNDFPVSGQLVRLPATVLGTIGRAGDVDFFRFEAGARQEIGVQVTTAGSKLNPMLELTDAAGNRLRETSDGLLGYTCVKAGTYAVGIRDRDFRGGPDLHYRLHIGDVPVITAVFPLGLQRGTEADVHLEGVNLAGARSVRVKAPADAAPGDRLPVSATTPTGAALGSRSVVVGEFPEVARRADIQSGPPLDIPVPGTGNGRIDKPGASETWGFAARKGSVLILEVNARRIGSPLDSFIEVLDSQGRPVPRATLRCLAKTDIIFRDHDSTSSGIRIQSWNELAMNDYLLCGEELLRIKDLPKNPDDDCQFVSVAGQRVGFLDTTPTFHSLGSPLYKVAIHPPGAVFPPNGFPVVTLYYRNDDGGPGYGKDSRLFFDPPADGSYLVRVTDARGLGDSNFGYQLTVRPPRPSFTVSFAPTDPAVWKGGAVPITVTANRLDHFDGPIDVCLENLPAGFSAPATTIPAEENSTAFALMADANAHPAAHPPALQLVARAMIAGKEVVRKATGGMLRPIDPRDIVTTTDKNQVTLAPGGQARLVARIERHNGFKGRVPIEVQGLPHGVRVLDIGLNGILITEKETSRTIVIYCEPWVQPMTHPFVVLAKSENKGTDHAAGSVLLRVAK
jgi:WD40 repeat protein